MTNKDFQKLLDQYQRQDCTPEEREYVEKWIESIQREEVPFLINFSEKEFQFKEKILGAIRPGLEFSQHKKVLANRRKVRNFYWAAAAMVIISCALFFSKEFFQEGGQSLKDRVVKGELSGRTIQNNGRESQEVKLDDGSVICLESGGTLVTDPAFNNAKERIIHLEGKAFFEVAHDVNRPFLVVTKNLVTRVLGTSFTINAERGEEESVVVKTGKVAVYHSTEESPSKQSSSFVTLTPNYQVHYDQVQQKLVTGIVKHPVLIPHWEDSLNRIKTPSQPQKRILKMKFREVSPVEILKALEAAYGIKIKYDESKISGCVLTASLKDEDFYTRLQTVCDLIGGEYRVNGHEIVVHSPGCK